MKVGEAKNSILNTDNRGRNCFYWINDLLYGFLEKWRNVL